ncbi:MAG: hypothetical protein DI556_19220 [Rhodovulum sulfidophilum]|uniref:Uncharacterized protein n=1 Tax=Rhodovulum sulfidophilum TaxID=35806 RepID=A0A2W5N111_RHOSU|nr:MAG: hypothetical protein DI556_19220 [Rhodovulum sulfidophilum]
MAPESLIKFLFQRFDFGLRFSLDLINVPILITSPLLPNFFFNGFGRFLILPFQSFKCFGFKGFKFLIRITIFSHLVLLWATSILTMRG